MIIPHWFIRGQRMLAPGNIFALQTVYPRPEHNKINRTDEWPPHTHDGMMMKPIHNVLLWCYKSAVFGAMEWNARTLQKIDVKSMIHGRSHRRFILCEEVVGRGYVLLVLWAFTFGFGTLFSTMFMVVVGKVLTAVAAIWWEDVTSGWI